jgi:hypothetical protein
MTEEQILDVVLFTVNALDNSGILCESVGLSEASEIADAYMKKDAYMRKVENYRLRKFTVSG